MKIYTKKQPITLKMDHIVIAAADLDQGRDWVREQLGVDVPMGGEHPKMGTHNLLMQLGSDVFLEVIAVNPAMAAPDRPRWYGLDDPHVCQRLAAGPVLLGWVVNTDDIRAVVDRAGISMGRPERISRGNLSWYFGLPADGRLLAGGMLPYVIQWEADVHPAGGMADLGCRILHLDIFHPCPDWIRGRLAEIGGAELVRVNSLPKNTPPYLSATIQTPVGVKVIPALS